METLSVGMYVRHKTLLSGKEVKFLSEKKNKKKKVDE